MQRYFVKEKIGNIKLQKLTPKILEEFYNYLRTESTLTANSSFTISISNLPFSELQSI